MARVAIVFSAVPVTVTSLLMVRGLRVAPILLKREMAARKGRVVQAALVDHADALLHLKRSMPSKSV